MVYVVKELQQLDLLVNLISLHVMQLVAYLHHTVVV